MSRFTKDFPGLSIAAAAFGWFPPPPRALFLLFWLPRSIQHIGFRRNAAGHSPNLDFKIKYSGKTALLHNGFSRT